MHLTRLSRIETIPFPSQPRSLPNHPSGLPHLLIRMTTFLLLTISIILLLIALLLPNSNTNAHLSSFRIRPVDKIYVPPTLVSVSTSTSPERPIATGMWGQDETEIQPSAIMSPHKIPEGDIVWYGITGPEIWVGPMQICSRSDIHSDVICTSSSTPAFHARVLPFNHADSLLALPQRPISPVLLLVTAICVLLSIIIHAFSLSNLGTCRRRRHPDSDLISSPENAVDSEDQAVSRSKQRKPHLAFSFLLVIGFVLSVAASAVERRSINDALEAWDVSAGNDIGLMAEMGLIAHLIPLIPFILSLTLLSAYAPLLPYFTRNRNPPIVISGAEVRGRAEISGLFAHVTDSGKKLSDGKPVFAEIDPGTPRLSVLPLPDIVIVAAGGVEQYRSSEVDGEKGWVADQECDVVVEEELEKKGGEVPRSATSSRTFGVGEAV